MIRSALTSASSAPVAQSAEAADSKSVQCAFESHRGHHLTSENPTYLTPSGPLAVLERVIYHRNRYQPASEVRKVSPVDLNDMVNTPALTAEKCPGCGCNARPYTGSPPHTPQCPYR